MSQVAASAASEDSARLQPHVDAYRAWVDSLLQACSEVIVGQEPLLRRMLMALVGGGHLLLEGLPGLAKTTSIRTLGKVAGLQFGRVQFTPDLLPADVVGTQIYDPKAGEFRTRTGPIFANLILADEINRAPAKVQSALLEAMEERQVTLADASYPLPQPFVVMATQNPIEQEGTYALPEAQLDRFWFKVELDYPSFAQELEVVQLGNARRGARQLAQVGEDLETFGQLLRRIHVAPAMLDYVVRLVRATRDPAAAGVAGLDGKIAYGASPRGSLGLERAARLRAMEQGRTFVIPADVQEVAPDVLRHRIGLTYEAEAEGLRPSDVVARLLLGVHAP